MSHAPEDYFERSEQRTLARVGLCRRVRRVKPKRTAKRQYVDRRIIVTVYCPKLPAVREDEAHERMLNLANYRDVEWLTFMQDNYSMLGGELPTLFPALPNKAD